MRKGKARITINDCAKKMTMLFNVRIATRFPDAKRVEDISLLELILL